VTERASERFWKKLIGQTDMEDALKRLDKLTQEEARMATAEVLRTTHAINNRVASVDDKVARVIHGAQIIISQPWEMLNLDCSDGKEAKQIMKQTANDVDQTKRPSSSNILFLRLTGFCR
jgi:hypothetical protein